MEKAGSPFFIPSYTSFRYSRIIIRAMNAGLDALPRQTKHGCDLVDRQFLDIAKQDDFTVVPGQRLDRTRKVHANVFGCETRPSFV